MLKVRARHAGTTLIELMVALVVMGVLLSVAIPAFRNWMQSAQIRSAAESVQDGLQLALNHAVTLNNSVQFVLSGADSTWAVGCAASSAACPGFIQGHSAVEGAPNAATAATLTTVVFNGLGRLVPTPGSAVTFAVTNPKGGDCAVNGGPMRCLNVQVSAGGQIRMCDPALTLIKPTDPQAC